MTPEKIAERGKAAERDVKKYLQEVSLQYFDFDFDRIYDARSAGGKFPSRPGDFEFYYPGRHGLIEVKEVNHVFRLPEKNFNKRAIARLRKRQLAGGTIVVVVRHSPTGLWREVPLSFFVQRADQPSWDLTEFPAVKTSRELLKKYVEGPRRHD
jgi:hypothetical protein